MKPNNKEKDLLLEKAAISYVEQESKRILKKMEDLKKDPSLQPTKEQRDAFLKLLKREQSQLSRKRKQKHALQFAAVLLAVIVGFTSMSFVFVEAFRIRVLYMLRQFQGTHVELGLNENIDNEILNIFMIRRLPYDFFVDSYEVHPGRELLYVRNGAEDYITVNKFEESYRVNVDTEDAVLENLVINGIELLLINKDGNWSVVWNDNQDYFILYTNLDFETIKQLF